MTRNTSTSRVFRVFGQLANLRDRKRSAARRRRNRIALERLEDRRLLAVVSWTGEGDGTSWHNPYNWSPQGVPAEVDDVMIDDDSRVATITIDRDTTVASIESYENIEVRDAVLSIETLSAHDLSITSGKITALPQTTLAIDVKGNLTVGANSHISADGLGYAGGGFATDGSGPGGGLSEYDNAGGGSHAGRGGVGKTANSGLTYGSIMEPTEFGSGGGGVASAHSALEGGNGGGAIRLIVGELLTVDGKISANGFSALEGGGGGAGGSIWITTDRLQIGGMIEASGGDSYGAGGGGGGRIAIEHEWHGTGASFDYSSKTVRAFGGTGYRTGGAGTVHIHDTVDLAGRLFIDHGGMQDGVTELAEPLKYKGRVYVQRGAVLAAPPQTTLHVEIDGNLSVGPEGHISADGRGYEGGQSSAGEGSGAGDIIYDAGAGGSHAGRGGQAKAATSGPTYGSITEPTSFGSGGGGAIDNPGAELGGAGGGAIRIIVSNQLEIEGKISANGLGADVGDGGGAGGSVWITAGRVTGFGSLEANGGDSVGGGGGGGGRLAIEADQSFGFGRSYAHGGDGFQVGGAGTIFDRALHPTQEMRRLAIDNRGQNGGWTELTDPLEFDGNITIRGGAILTTPSETPLELTVNGHFVVEPDGHLSADGRGYAGGEASVGEGPGGGGFIYDTAAGGSHAGQGGHSKAATAGPTYGSVTTPITFGSGGGGAISNPGTQLGGAGGGAIRLMVTHRLRVFGEISANGLDGDFGDGGGAGGSVWITAGAFDGPGVIQADGGAGAGGGGGGRVAIYTVSEPEFSLQQATASGGNGGSSGEDGSVYFEKLGLPKVEIRLKADSDSGASSNDRLTNNSTPTFEVVVNQAGSIDVVREGLRILLQTDVNQAGVYDQQFSQAFADGEVSVTANFTPRFGDPLSPRFLDPVSHSLTFMVDTSGPKVLGADVGGAPLGTFDSSVDAIDVTFDSQIDAATFGADDVILTGPDGVIPVHEPIHVSDNTWQISFDPLQHRGDYSLTIGPDVRDLAGNAMDQDGDATNGEVDDDVFVDSLTINTPQVVVLEGAGTTLSLAQSDMLLNGVETIDIRGTGNNTLILDTERMKMMSEDGELSVISDSGDQVIFDDGWEFSQALLLDGQFVRQFVHAGMVLNLTGPDDFTNPINRFDVNGKSGVSASDALNVINEIARRSFVEDSGNIRDLSTVNLRGYRFFDTNGDHRVTALDALQVINELARNQVAASGEAVATLDESEDPETRVFDPAMQVEQFAVPPSKTSEHASWEQHADAPTQELVSPNTARNSESAEREELIDFAIQELW